MPQTQTQVQSNATAKSRNSNTDQGVFFYDYNIEETDQREEILTGLQQQRKNISAKYFYDERGSQLFEAITGLPEYYPTRTEISLLKQFQNEIAHEAGTQAVLVEYGSGASTKIRLLLEALRPQAYVPMDISKDFLYDCAIQLRKEFPWLEIHATCLDYRERARLPHRLSPNAKKVAFFPGSSLGNFAPADALLFLKGVRETVGEKGALLIGVDLQKDVDELEAAYNDVQGVTAEFNLNVLRHLNQLGNGNFNVEHFHHYAFYNAEHHRIEMRLVSELDQMASIFGERILFKKGEHIVTEYSYKFKASDFMEFVRGAGFCGKHYWHDAEEKFGLFWLEAMESD